MVMLPALIGKHPLGRGRNKELWIELFYMKITEVKVESMHPGMCKQDRIEVSVAELVDPSWDVSPNVFDGDVRSKCEHLRLTSGR